MIYRHNLRSGRSLAAGAIPFGRMFRRFPKAVAASAAALVCTLNLLGCADQAKPVARTSVSLPGGLSELEFQRSAETFYRLYGRAPDRLDVLSVAAEAAVAEGRLEQAAELFAAIPSDHPAYGHSARFQAGQVLLRLNRAVEAEKQLREFLNLEGSDPQMKPEYRHDAQQRLRYILEIELRFRERHELLAGMIDRGEADLIDTQLYLFPNLLRWNGAAAVSQCEAFYANDPDDPYVGAAMGRYRLGQGRIDDATELLEALHQKHPTHLLTAAALLSCHYERRDWDQMGRVAAGLPPAEDSDPWLLSMMRGRLATHRSEFKGAVEHFERLLRDDPANAEACTALAEAYGKLGLDDQRAEQLQRMRGLARLRPLLGAMQEQPDETEPLRQVAAVCEEMGLTSHARLAAQLADKVAAASVMDAR